jgi:hypothetical protein
MPNGSCIISYRAAALMAALFLAGCAGGYSPQESCADLSKSVWPWRTMTGMATETLPSNSPLNVIQPESVVRVSGTLPPDAKYQEPTPALFQCVYSGDVLRSFGWIEPQMLADPNFSYSPG